MRIPLLCLALALPVAAEVSFYEAGHTASTAVANIDTPCGMDLASDGTLYVGHGFRSSTLRGRIHRVRPDGAVEPFGAVLVDPDPVVVDSEDRVYVGTRRGGLFRILPDGTTSVFAGNTVTVDGVTRNCLYNVDALTRDGDDRIYATNTAEPALTRVDPDGSVHILRTYATAPKGIRFGCDGALYIAFVAEGSIHRYDPATGVETIFSSGLPSPVGLCEDPGTGDLIVSCVPYSYVAGTGRLFRVHLDGTWSPLADGLDHPVDVLFDRPGRLLVSDELANRIWSIDGFRPGGFDEVVTTRERGKPVRLRREFHVCGDGHRTIAVTSGDALGAHRATSAIVWIDGAIAVPAASFNPRVGEVRAEVRLFRGEHVLEVELRGAPGDVLRVRLE